MTTEPYTTQATCPQCNNYFNKDIYPVINSEKHPEVLELLLNRKILAHHCTTCMLTYPFVYLTMFVHEPTKTVVSLVPKGIDENQAVGFSSETEDYTIETVSSSRAYLNKVRELMGL